MWSLNLRQILPLPLQLLPCLLNGNNHFLPTSNGSYLNIGTTTKDDPLQAQHYIRIALHQSVIQYVDRCLHEDVLDDLILRVGVNLLEFLDNVVVRLFLM